MRKLLVIAIGIVFSLSNCKKSHVESIAEAIAKSWVVSSVHEGGSQVYQVGSLSNIKPAYIVFRLELHSSGTVVFIDFDGTKFAGIWEVTNEETKLILKNLTPTPTGTGDIIEFSIDGLTETSLTLTRITPSRKTGNSVNKYVLIKE